MKELLRLTIKKPNVVHASYVWQAQTRKVSQKLLGDSGGQHPRVMTYPQLTHGLRPQNFK